MLSNFKIYNGMQRLYIVQGNMIFYQRRLLFTLRCNYIKIGNEQLTPVCLYRPFAEIHLYTRTGTFFFS